MPSRTPLAFSLPASLLLLAAAFALPARGQVHFVRKASAPTGRSPSAIGVADMNGDGVADVVVANRIDGEVDFTRGVLIDGQWQAEELTPGLFYAPIPAGGGTRDVAMGDFDGDGFMDAATADATSGTVTFVRGTSVLPVRMSETVVPPSPQRVRAADYDQDGRDDLVVACTGDVAVLRGRTGGAFEVQVLSVPATGAIVGAAFGDADGNGVLDIGIVALRPGSTPSRPFLASDFFLYVIGAGGRYVLSTRFSFDPALLDATDVLATNIDGDRVADWAVSSASGGVYLREAGGAAARFVPTARSVRAMESGDFDGDGNEDLALLTASPNVIDVVQSDGAGGLIRGVPIPSGSGSIDFAPGTLDADGRLDLAIVGDANDYAIPGKTIAFVNRSAPPCARGNVNAGAGTPVNVLLLNDEAGDAVRQTWLFPGDPLRIAVAAPPSLARAPFALYVWAGWPDAGGPEYEIPGVGRTCFPTPLTAGGAAPVIVWNNTGVRRLGLPTLPSLPAPTVLVDSPRGVRRPTPARVYLQGVIADAASTSGRGASVTNGIFLKIR